MTINFDNPKDQKELSFLNKLNFLLVGAYELQHNLFILGTMMGMRKAFILT